VKRNAEIIFDYHLGAGRACSRAKKADNPINGAGYLNVSWRGPTSKGIFHWGKGHEVADARK